MSPNIESLKIELAPGKIIEVETGRMAWLASGSLTIKQGDTVVLVAVCHAKAQPNADFFPLQVEYREKFSAAGRIPVGFFKREGRPSEKEILTARMTDRPLRPLFPEYYYDEVQVTSFLLSTDQENEPDVLSILGSSIALAISDIPWNGPIGACRVGRIQGKFVVNPTHSEMASSDLDLIYAGLEDKTIMIEGSAREVSEEVLRDAFIFANEIIKKQIAAIREFAARVGKPKYTPELFIPDANLIQQIASIVENRFEIIDQITAKAEREQAMDALLQEVTQQLLPTHLNEDKTEEEVEREIKRCFEIVYKKHVRTRLLEGGRRIDGRQIDQIRPLKMEVGVLPRLHGSALFARGETQTLVVVTLGSSRESQESDAISGGDTEKHFILHYNFPPFSVGECGRYGSPGRREIGHGALAERCLAPVMPSEEEFPYTVRCVSDVMTSNGSTSMASVCGGSLALMDAGVPIKKAVAGISCGLVSDLENNRYLLLTDIIGDEDHYGDMDFKVAGTSDGITGFQLDLKIAGLPIPVMYEALKRNCQARRQILEAMNQIISQPRAEVSPYAPRIKQIKINKEKIGALIGPGGSVIREICSTWQVEIDVQDDGTVNIYANDKEKMEKAEEAVLRIAAEVEIGKVYRGTVKSIKDFGVFVEVLPGQEGLVHISELADYRVRHVEDIANVGDKMTVKCIGIDERGRIKLSRKAALKEIE